MTVRMRHTRAHTRNRRSHHALKATVVVSCPKCGEAILPHKMCLKCGFYKGREVIDTLAKLTKKERKIKEKEQEAQVKEKASKKSLDAKELSKK